MKKGERIGGTVKTLLCNRHNLSAENRLPETHNLA